MPKCSNNADAPSAYRHEVGVDQANSNSFIFLIADRAASLLQVLRGDGEGIVSEAPSRDESPRVRRRRETADDERTRRRKRRRRAGTSTNAGVHSTTIEETETLNEEESEEESRRSSRERQLLTSPGPGTIVAPPSPTTSERGRADEK